jgi:hypothetical protein
VVAPSCFILGVSTGGGEGDCGFDVETGSQYLVYADKVDNASLVTSICSGTSLLAHADSALRVLRGEQPTQDDLLDGETYYKQFGPLWTGIEVHDGEKISDLQFSIGKARLHTVLFHIVSADGSLLPLEKFGVSIDAPERDALAYHLTQTRSINGEFPAGYVPSGELLVQTYLRPDLKTGKIPAELLRWRMARQEMYIGTDSEIIFKLSRAN